MIRLLLVSLMMLLSSAMCFAGAAPKHTQQVLPAHEHTEKCEQTSAEPIQIICILDRSGSMKNLAGDTIGGYNSFIEKQRKEEGSAEVTTVLFDDQYDKIVDAVDIRDVPELTSKEYYARGMTALLDAVGRTIMDTAGRMEKEGICPEKRRVIFFIMTDGQENDSKEYDRASVKAMIETATKEYNWNFIFMGANIDSVSEAASIGIDSKHAVDYDYNGAGIRQSFDRMDAAVSEMRETGTVGDQWKDK